MDREFLAWNSLFDCLGIVFRNLKTRNFKFPIYIERYSKDIRIIKNWTILSCWTEKFYFYLWNYLIL